MLSSIATSLRPGAAAVLLLGALACSDAVTVPDAAVVPSPRSVNQVIVDIDSTVMTVGSRGRSSAQPLDVYGNPIAGRTSTWSAQDPSVLTVTADGAVTAVGAGVTQVVATIEGVRGERDVVIRALPGVGLVVVALSREAFSLGDTLSATLVVYDSSGVPLSGRAVRWSISGDASVATVSQAGLLTALAPGTAALVAEVDSSRGSIEFSVLASRSTSSTVASVTVSLASPLAYVGQQVQAVASAFDSAGQILALRPVTWSLVAGAGVVSLSATGMVSTIAAGNALVGATIDGVRGVAPLSVRDSATVPSRAIALPTLPETLSFEFPRARGRQWNVRAGDDLQTILNSAQRGDEIILEAGAAFSGNFTLPSKSGTPADGWILVRSDQLSQLPARGTRVTALRSPLMPKLVTPNTSAALSTLINASGWWLAGIEFTVASSVTGVVGRVVALGVGGAPQTSLSVVPSDLVLDRVYIHPQPHQNVQRCLELNSARTVLEDSYLMDCHAKGYDSQAIVGWNGPGPFRVVNNTLAGAGENVMFGGADPVIPDLIPSDVQLSRNYIYTPASWKGVWTKKNLIETKNVARFLIEGNVIEGSWTDGQVGYALVLKVANQSGRCTWCAARDLTIRNNIIRNVGGVFGITGKEGANPHPVGERMNRLLIENNIAESVNVAPYVGDGRLVSIMQNAQNVTIRSNTMTTTGSLAQFLNLGSIPAATDFAFDHNIVSYGTYGLFSSKYGLGEVSLQGFGGAVSFSGNVLVGSQKQGYPSAQFVPTLSAAQQRAAGANQSLVDAATINVIIP